MFITALHLAVLAAPCAPIAVPAVGPQEAKSCQSTPCDHGKLDWFEGTWEELMAEARRTNKLVFLDFYAEWCGWCKRLDKEAFSDARVVAATKDVLCFLVDKESKAAAPLNKRFNIYPLPTLIFLEPDGQMRDCLFGYHSPDAFLAEVGRIKRNEGTITSVRRSVEAEPKNLELRYTLAMRLRKARDFEGSKHHMDVIRELDPEGRTLTSRRIALHRIVDQARRSNDPEPIYAFLSERAEPELLFLAWRVLHKIEGDLMGRAADADRAAHRSRWLVAARKAWAHVPLEEMGPFGNNLAWGIYEARSEVEEEDLLFAVDVARQAVAILPEDANVIDTLACCLYAIGEKEEAIQLVKRCIELQPKNDGWKKRLKDFRRK